MGNRTSIFTRTRQQQEEQQEEQELQTIRSGRNPIFIYDSLSFLLLSILKSKKSKNMSEKQFRFSIDRGGTFTDIFCEIIDAKTHCSLGTRVSKLLSEDPGNYKDAPIEGIRRILEEETGEPHPRGVPVDSSRIEFIRMGTTVATNGMI
jgi:hypothetical protein